MKSNRQKLDSALQLTTPDHKIGQANQYNDNWNATGPVTLDDTRADHVKKGKV